MSFFKRKDRARILSPEAERAQREAQQAKAEAYARTDEVNTLADSLRTLHEQNHLAEAIIASMAVRSPRRRRRIWIWP